MLFRVLPKDELVSLFEILAINRIVGPTRKAISKEGTPIWAFDWLYSFDELDFEYTSTSQSPKKYFLPYQETLSTFTFNKSGWEKSVEYNHYNPTVFFGMHACDINALNRLDRVMLESVYPNPYYAEKRKNMFIVGVGCVPQQHCFCRSMDADSVLHGFDLFLTDIGDRYFIEVQTANAFEILKHIGATEATNHEHALFVQTVEEKNRRFTCSVDTTDLSKILDMEFKSEEWVKWGEKCMSCGTCANVCPTCYCFGIQELVDIDLKGARKEKHLYSCNLVDFAQVAGGHNFRPESHTRLKYRYYHKHRGFVEAFEESLCVGCGRCGQACLSGITVPEVIGSIRQEAQQNEQE